MNTSLYHSGPIFHDCLSQKGKDILGPLKCSSLLQLLQGKLKKKDHFKEKQREFGKPFQIGITTHTHTHTHTHIYIYIYIYIYIIYIYIYILYHPDLKVKEITKLYDPVITVA